MSEPQTQKTAQAGTPVDVVPATVGTASRATAVTGSLVSLQDVPLSSKITGRLAQVYVREGDSVTANQVVARLDTTDQESAVRSAEAAVSAAGARLAQAAAAYKQQLVASSSALKSAQAAYDQQLTNTRTGIQSAEAGLAAAQAQLSQVREGSRAQDVRKADTQVAIAKANLAKAQADSRRFRALAQQGAIGQSTLEQYETSETVAREQLRAAQETLSLVKEGARSQEVTQAEQSVRQAEERLRQARAATAMDKVRKADVDTARAALAQNDVRLAEVKAARAAQQQAGSSLAIARKALADSLIRTPIAGQVASRTGEPGQVVSSGSPILRVVALDTVFFEPTIPDRQIGQIRVGQPVSVTVNAVPGRTFMGTVTKVYPAGSQASRAFPIRVTIANPGRELRPQMFAQGRIETERKAGVVMVPVEALIRDSSEKEDDDHATLFTVSAGVARSHSVHIGLFSSDGKLVEASGIPASAQVVVSGQHGLADGDRVAATAPKPAQTASAQ